jgi:hypothetical protein
MFQLFQKESWQPGFPATGRDGAVAGNLVDDGLI